MTLYFYEILPFNIIYRAECASQHVTRPYDQDRRNITAICNKTSTLLMYDILPCRLFPVSLLSSCFGIGSNFGVRSQSDAWQFNIQWTLIHPVYCVLRLNANWYNIPRDDILKGFEVGNWISRFILLWRRFDERSASLNSEIAWILPYSQNRVPKLSAERFWCRRVCVGYLTLLLSFAIIPWSS